MILQNVELGKNKTVKTVKKGCAGLTVLENIKMLESLENSEILEKLDSWKFRHKKFWKWKLLKFYKNFEIL